MYAKNIPLADLQLAARDFGFDINTDQRDDRIMFTLKLKKGSQNRMKLSPNPTEYTTWFTTGKVAEWKWRKTGSVCFHGHYEFMQEVLDRNPAGIIESNWYGRIRYTAENFVDRANELGDMQMGREGNIYRGIQVRQCCNCER